MHQKQSGKNLTNMFLHLDLFRESFTIRLDYEGNYKHRTALGSIFSIVLFALLMMYTAQKVQLLDQHTQVEIQQATIETHFSEDSVFSKEQGLNIAVAFTDWDNEREPILNPTIGEILFEAVEWGYDDNGDFFTTKTILDSHYCSAEELGF